VHCSNGQPREVTEAELPKVIKGDAEAGKASDGSDGTPAGTIDDTESTTTTLGKFKKVGQARSSRLQGRGAFNWRSGWHAASISAVAKCRYTRFSASQKVPGVQLSHLLTSTCTCAAVCCSLQSFKKVGEALTYGTNFDVHAVGAV
jgi:hypothetical protein